MLLFFQIVLVVTSLLLLLLVLLHKGKGGGLSDMFGGGVSTNFGGASIAERNLDRLTIAVAVVWTGAIFGALWVA
jgi:preprotein translocase subunit SecG